MYKGLFIATALILSAASSTSAWAGWGCAAEASDGTIGRVWSADNEQSARRDAIKYCANGGHRGCHVIGCADSVDSQSEAHVLWPGGTVTKCFNETASNPCRKGNID